MDVRSDISALLGYAGVEGMAYYEFDPAAPPGRRAAPDAVAPASNASPSAETKAPISPAPERSTPSAPRIPFAVLRRQQGAFDLRDYGEQALRAEMKPPIRLKLTVPADAPSPAKAKAPRPAATEQAPPKSDAAPTPMPAIAPESGSEAGRLAIKPVAETPPEKESLQDLFARL